MTGQCPGIAHTLGRAEAYADALRNGAALFLLSVEELARTDGNEGAAIEAQLALLQHLLPTLTCMSCMTLTMAALMATAGGLVPPDAREMVAEKVRRDLLAMSAE